VRVAAVTGGMIGERILDLAESVFETGAPLSSLRGSIVSAEAYLGAEPIGALAVIRYAKIHGTRHRPWLTALLARRPTKVAAIALANKIARMAWAMMARGERYKEPAALAA